MASNFALVKMQLFFEAVLLLATLVIQALNSGSISSYDTRVADSTLKGKQSGHQAFAPTMCSHTCMRYQSTAQAHCCSGVFY